MNPEIKQKLEDVHRRIEKIPDELRKKVILIVDKDKKFVDVICDILTKMGERAFGTDNIYQFFEWVGKNSIKGLILGCNQDVCTGSEVLKYLEGNPIHTIIVCKSCDLEGTLNTNLNGFHNLKKPDSENDCIDFVHYIIDICNQ